MSSVLSHKTEYTIEPEFGAIGSYISRTIVDTTGRKENAVKVVFISRPIQQGQGCSMGEN